jgi:hypothetical protein
MPRVTRSIAEQWLSDPGPQLHFWCNDGRVLRSLDDLDGALREMDDNVFSYHATEEKNDFSSWVGDVFGDDKLARDLGKSANRKQAAKAVSGRIRWLRGKLEG